MCRLWYIMFFFLALLGPLTASGSAHHGGNADAWLRTVETSLCVIPGLGMCWAGLGNDFVELILTRPVSRLTYLTTKWLFIFSIILSLLALNFLSESLLIGCRAINPDGFINRVVLSLLAASCTSSIAILVIICRATRKTPPVVLALCLYTLLLVSTNIQTRTFIGGSYDMGLSGRDIGFQTQWFVSHLVMSLMMPTGDFWSNAGLNWQTTIAAVSSAVFFFTLSIVLFSKQQFSYADSQ